MKTTTTDKLTERCLTAALLALSLLTAACSGGVESLDDGPSGSGNGAAANPGEVAFSAYLTRPATRAGLAGSLTTDALKTGTHAAEGFSVMAY